MTITTATATATPETLFDFLGQRYEDAFANSAGLISFIEKCSASLPANSNVLDVGCGTGKPVSHILSSAGHTVYGVDVSAEMVKIANRQVKGKFEKADMRTYTPEEELDAVFVIFSLYQFTPGETYSMIYRFSSWLKPGGILVIGTTPSTSLPKEAGGVNDSVWDSTRLFSKPWMDKYVHDLFFSEAKWKDMLGEAGFRVEKETGYDFVPQDQNHTVPERHYLVSGRKVESEPLLGPYPVPIQQDKGLEVTLDMERLESGGLAGILNSARGKALYLGAAPPLGSNIDSYEGPLTSLPFVDKTFDTVIAVLKLDSVQDVGKAVSEVLRVTTPSPNSRIVFVHGAPDNEANKYLKSLGQPLRHQGALLGSAMEELKKHGLRTSLNRVRAHYAFPEEERCDVAARTLLGTCSQDEGHLQELKSKLSLHFKDGCQGIGSDMVALTATYPQP